MVTTPYPPPWEVACGAASRLRLKPIKYPWKGYSWVVACGAASRLRLKHKVHHPKEKSTWGRMWSGFSSEIETEMELTLKHLLL